MTKLAELDAQLTKAEKRVTGAVASALALWLAANDFDTPVDVAAARANWEFDHAPGLEVPLSNVWNERYEDSGEDFDDASVAALALFLISVHARLLAIPNAAIAKIESGEDYDYRPHAGVVGRTEAQSAFNDGAYVGYGRVPGLVKQWASLHDGHTRPTHVHADMQRRPVSATFDVGGYPARYPGDPLLPPQEAVNCRCVLTFHLEDTVSEPLVAAPGDTAELGLPSGWIGPIAGLDRPTGDGRMLVTPQDGLRTRQYPMSMTRQHVGETDVYIGTVDRAWIGEDGMLWGEGSFDLGGDDGRESARLVGEGAMNTVSITPDEVTWEQRFYNAEGELVDSDDALVRIIDGDIEHLEMREGYTFVDAMVDWRLANLAHVSVPAYDEARIEPVWDYVRPTVTDQPDWSDHSMIALRIANPESFAVAGGSEPDQLHVTLAYLGDQRLDENVYNAAENAALRAAELVKRKGRRKMKVAGYGVLGTQDPPATVLFLNGGGILDAQAEVMSSLDDYGLEAFPEQHEPFLAHMTIGYGVDPAVAAGLVGLELDIHAVSMDHGKDRVTYEIGDDPVVATVTGAVDLPVAGDRKLKWDGSKAGVTLQEHYGEDWGAISKAYLWKNPDPKGSIDDFRLPYATIIDGKLTIVPNGVIGLAGGHGITGTDLPAAAKTKLLAKLCDLYDQVRRVHPDFPTCPFGDADAALVAAAGQVFEAKSFLNPQLDAPTPLTVTDDGRVFGHAALWESCYMQGGGARTCMKPPRGGDYSRFHVHGARLESGDVLAVGALTFGEGHREHGSLRASQRAYANVATMAAKVRVGEDEFGVWVAGEVLDAFRDRADDLLLSPLSGHWEPDMDLGGKLTMIAAHVVVTPGFAVPRIVASFDPETRVQTGLMVTHRAEDFVIETIETPAARLLTVLKQLGMDPASRVLAAQKLIGMSD